ncbi:hypothetical protein Q9189_003022 [Teloschistes chrysophthalmus]
MADTRPLSVMTAPYPNRHENGREYHGYRAGMYMYPCDNVCTLATREPGNIKGNRYCQAEQQRMDYMHALFNGARNEQLHEHPIVAPDGFPRILDLGCGTGIWCMDMAQKYPNADARSPSCKLSAIPSNTRWRMPRDFESPWNLGEDSFDLIHLRLGCGSVSNWHEMYSNVIRHLRPRTGRFEQVEIDIQPRCDDGSLPEGATINRWYDALKSATQIAGRPIAYNPATPQMLAAHGFVDIRQRKICLPLSYWRGSGGPRREIAHFYPLALTDEAGLEAYSLGPLTRAPVSWPVEDVMRYSFMAGRKKGFKVPQPLSRAWTAISYQLPPATFITIHYAYFIGVSLLASIIFWGSSTPARSISYTDSLFLVVSAMTLAGLNTVNLSQANTFQRVILFLLTLLGSTITVSIAVVYVRMKAFERRFTTIVEEEKRKQKERKSLRQRITMRTNSASKSSTGLHTGDGELKGRLVRNETPPENKSEDKDLEMGDRVLPIGQEQAHEARGKPSIVPLNTHMANQAVYPGMLDGMPRRRGVTFSEDPSSPARIAPLARIFSMQGVGARHDLPNHPIRIPRPENFLSPVEEEHHEKTLLADLIHKFSIPGVVSRNSQFSHLSITERERLGGVEYRTLELLILVVPLYFFAWQFLGAIGMGAWVANNGRDLTETNGLNPWWVGAFNAVSGFNNSGMMLLDANMVAFQTSSYPVFLRLILWTIWSLLRFLPATPKVIEYRVTLRFLLDHPRRCYTNLFPSRHTWWLLATLLGLNGIDWIAFEILNIGNKAINVGKSSGTRAIDGLFQALAVRSGGFYVVTVANLRIGLLILYVIMMYISVYPVVITMRNSNVYEERSLGIYSDHPDDSASDSTLTKQKSEIPPTPKEALISGISGLKRRLTVMPNGSNSASKPAALETRGYFVRQQLRGQLAHDLWWVVLAILFITITETSSFERDPKTYSVFNIIFEVISAYGTVGLSVGLPDQAYSFSGGWHVFSKLVLCAVMIRGRHRGLPVAIDRAVLLPSDNLAAAEEEDALIRMEKSGTKVSGVPGSAPAKI